MTDSSFQAAGYAVLTKDDANQKFTSTLKTYAPLAYVSQIFTCSQLRRPFTPRTSYQYIGHLNILGICFGDHRNMLLSRQASNQ